MNAMCVGTTVGNDALNKMWFQIKNQGEDTRSTPESVKPSQPDPSGVTSKVRGILVYLEEMTDG